MLNGFSSLSNPNLRIEVPSYISLKGFSWGSILSRRSSRFSPLSVCLFELGVPGGLISLSVSGSFQGFSSSSFNPIAFIPGVVSGILKVFHEDVSLSGVLLSISCLDSSGVLWVD